MYTCFYYWLIEPLRGTFKDTSESTPKFEVTIERDGDSYQLALFVDDSNSPEYARLKILDLDNKSIPEELLPMIQAVKEHLLSVLRLTYHPDVKLFPRPIWTFIEDVTDYSMGLDFSYISSHYFDAERAKRLLVSGFRYREEIRLLIDGLDSHIPLQYRYLSLYKVLELHFRSRGRWKQKALEKVIDAHKSSFEEKGITRKPINHIHALRDKCAHIKTGNRDEIGVTHLNYEEAAEVQKILPILADICIEIINDKTQGAVEVQRVHRSFSSIQDKST